MDKTYGPELLVSYTDPCDDEVVTASIGIHHVDGADHPELVVHHLGVVVRHCGALVTHYKVPWTVFDPSPHAVLTDAMIEAAAGAVYEYMRAVELFARTAIENPCVCADLLTGDGMAASLFKWRPEDERYVKRFVRNAIYDMKYAAAAHNVDEHSD